MTNIWKKYEHKGLTGLANLGNTCFINSCFQVLSNTYEFNEFLEDGSFTSRLSAHIEKKYAVDCFMIIEYYKLLKLVWDTNCIISPTSFVKTIQNVAKQKKLDLFTTWNQNDISEFLLFIFECFHNSLRREVVMNVNGSPENNKDDMAVLCYNEKKRLYSNEYSEIITIFSGIHMSRIMDTTGEVLSMCPEVFTLLTLPLPENNKSPSLVDCLNIYCEKESLSGDNAWFNDKTNQKQNVNKQIIFWSLPTIMIIVLKRFNFTGRKLQTPVDIPIDNLDMSGYVYGYDKYTYNYELYGICNHMGGSGGGHYTAFVKNASGKWYSYNDTIVSEINIETSLNKNYAYCLFYRKKVAI